MENEGSPRLNDPLPSGALLPRRSYVGLQIAPGTGVSDGAPGLYVRSVAAGSAAERAGARAGDRLLALGNCPVSELNGVRQLLRGLGVGAALELQVLRGREVLDLLGEVRAYPVEQHAHGRVLLEQVHVGPHRLRAICVLPETAGPHPVLYYLPGAHWASEEYPFTPNHPVPALIGQLAQLGIASVRVERFGMGDSEGPPCNDVDFSTEYAGYVAGAQLLERASWCDRGRVVFFGHSLGAMVAPLLATDSALGLAPLALFTFGASAIPISSGLQTALRRFAHMQPHVTAETIEGQCKLLALIVAGGRTPKDVLREHPELRPYAPAHFTDDTIYRRTVRFYHQLEQQALDAAWRRIDCPVLTIHGTDDWICAPEDSQHIANISRHGEFRAVSNTDHQFAEVPKAVDGEAKHAPVLQPRAETLELSRNLADVLTTTLSALFR
jgi:uncharacterized protein